MGHGPGRPVETRGRPHGHGRRRRSSSSSTPHLMGSGAVRPVKTHGPPHGPGGAAHIERTSHGPRPGPAHQFSRGWAAARPGPSNFQRVGRGPTQPITFSNFHGPARPGPSNFQKSRPGPAHHIFKSFGSARPGPDKRPMTSPVVVFLPAVLELGSKHKGIDDRSFCGASKTFLRLYRITLFSHLAQIIDPLSGRIDL